jgi:hypothetical protein
MTKEILKVPTADSSSVWFTIKEEKQRQLNHQNKPMDAETYLGGVTLDELLNLTLSEVGELGYDIRLYIRESAEKQAQDD